MTIARKIFTRTVVLAMLAVVLLGGVCAECKEGGMYQGGGDSQPHWRR